MRPNVLALESMPGRAPQGNERVAELLLGFEGLLRIDHPTLGDGAEGLDDVVVLFRGLGQFGVERVSLADRLHVGAGGAAELLDQQCRVARQGVDVGKRCRPVGRHALISPLFPRDGPAEPSSFSTN